MKLIKSILSLILVLSLVSCKETSDRKPNATGTAYATLIAYSIHGKHKRSDATIQLNKIALDSFFLFCNSQADLHLFNYDKLEIQAMIH
jgi:hypothetical protein